MESSVNPYSPGAGTPPPELAGREDLLERAEVAIGRARKARFARSMMLLGLRGVGKTVLLNRIDQLAEEADCSTAFFEVDPHRRLPELVTHPLHRMLLKLDRRKRVTDQVHRGFAQLRSFASTFRVKYGEFEIGMREGMATGDLAVDLTDLLVAVGEAAKSRGTAAAVMADEVQYLQREDLSALIVALHKVAQRQLPFVFFGAGLPQLARLAGEAKSYAERLFDFTEVGQLDDVSARAALVEPARRESVEFETKALDVILRETECYPFFLQVWGHHVWELASSSPITSEHAEMATAQAVASLDEGFFRVRLDGLTSRQQDYARAMAELGPRSATSASVANALGITTEQAAPIRRSLIQKGTAYSPKYGLVTFTVPKFDEFLKRAIPEWPMTGQ